MGSLKSPVYISSVWYHEWKSVSVCLKTFDFSLHLPTGPIHSIGRNIGDMDVIMSFCQPP